MRRRGFCPPIIDQDPEAPRWYQRRLKRLEAMDAETIQAMARRKRMLLQIRLRQLSRRLEYLERLGRFDQIEDEGLEHLL